MFSLAKFQEKNSRLKDLNVFSSLSFIFILFELAAVLFTESKKQLPRIELARGKRFQSHWIQEISGGRGQIHLRLFILIGVTSTDGEVGEFWDLASWLSCWLSSHL
ncbi:unnamed protein product [Durusdinium trenchii]|uniref:Uncharacterized protein n=1 Tax=Durusdinium trenchii TaxID=1381693 RepID=A0ABP0NLC0_9DINO